jgi:mRNA interferase MazF
MAPIAATVGTGLKVPSVVRFDTLATLDRSVVAGRIGVAPVDWLQAQRGIYFGVFGFGRPYPIGVSRQPRRHLCGAGKSSATC